MDASWAVDAGGLKVGSGQLSFGASDSAFNKARICLGCASTIAEGSDGADGSARLLEKAGSTSINRRPPAAAMRALLCSIFPRHSAISASKSSSDMFASISLCTTTELRASHPSFIYTPHRRPQAVQDGGRLAWGSGPPGEPPSYTGIDVIYRPRREDCRPICFPRRATYMMATGS